jgi:general secretion pathway protein E
VVLELEHLGLAPLDYEVVLRHLLRPHGMVLVTGPTGSGKTTTLYAFLTRVGAERQNVINLSTIEDPIEYTIPRVNQVPVNHQTGLDFAAGLRALLRQDPDVLMVGEIRDRETADVAVRAALVGRLLFSTLHTNDATSAVPRLLDMGIEPYLLASTLSLVVAQRLVRRLCTHCRESYAADEKTIAMLQQRDDFPDLIRGLQARGVRMSGDGSLKDLRLFRSKGCLHCQHTGYRGRFGIFELFEVKDKVKSLMIERRDAPLIRAAALEAGMRPLLVDGLAKVIMGDTSLEEVIRAAV